MSSIHRLCRNAVHPNDFSFNHVTVSRDIVKLRNLYNNKYYYTLLQGSEVGAVGSA